MADVRPTEWLEDLRSGNAEAARQIFDHFSKRLCRLAEKHLSVRLRQRVDGEDVVQSVFRTFFARESQGKLRLDHTDELWRLLVTITLRKARAVWRKNSADRRAVEREISLDESGSLQLNTLSREPTVVEAIVLADEIETLLDGLSEAHAKALELRMGGFTPTEAAAVMGVSRQSFYRLLDPLKERLEKRGQMLSSALLPDNHSDENGCE